MSLLVACGTSAGPSATVGDLTAVEQALALRGVTVLNAVSGDAGCVDEALHGNAVRLDVRLGDEPERSIYLFRWRRPAQFDDAARSFAECAGSHVGPPESELATLEVRPWRAYGTDWSGSLTSTIEGALRAAAGG